MLFKFAMGFFSKDTDSFSIFSSFNLLELLFADELLNVPLTWEVIASFVTIVSDTAFLVGAYLPYNY